MGRSIVDQIRTNGGSGKWFVRLTPTQALAWASFSFDDVDDRSYRVRFRGWFGFDRGQSETTAGGSDRSRQSACRSDRRSVVSIRSA
jgi:hypothetical protein